MPMSFEDPSVAIEVDDLVEITFKIGISVRVYVIWVANHGRPGLDAWVVHTKSAVSGNGIMWNQTIEGGELRVLERAQEGA